MAEERAELTLDEEIVRFLPELRRFANRWTHSSDRGGDLVQDAIVKALTARDRFAEGTNALAWLITIMRNHLFTSRKLLRNSLPHMPWDSALDVRATDSVQEFAVDAKRALERIETLPDDQKATLYQIALGELYEDIAAANGVAVGTIKSRVHRARKALTDNEKEETNG
ncbi:sigma-70 family RNA polymerase sigma factor [Mesorhizobium silamurunense]|uniref:sigma-70 family RNA polymerase sigma factor n=1 Tax=Mesorhizobium silamurunense TaxID=499528 RepID=UPI001783B065|nr:sigma-70 family RNA polymerase sigma factor [Mesorhizobium silamurunense]